MFALYVLLFVIFCGKLTLEILIFGLLLDAVLFLFSCSFLGWSPKKELGLFRSIGRAAAYGALLVREIVLANLKVMRMILTRGFEPRPQLVTFDSGLEGRGHRVALADSITLTPGTITCEEKEGVLLVHCLDNETMEGLEDSSFVRSLKAMEEEDARRQEEREERRRAAAAAKEERRRAAAAAKEEKSASREMKEAGTPEPEQEEPQAVPPQEEKEAREDDDR